MEKLQFNVCASPFWMVLVKYCTNALRESRNGTRPVKIKGEQNEELYANEAMRKKEQFNFCANYESEDLYQLTTCPIRIKNEAISCAVFSIVCVFVWARACECAFHLRFLANKTIKAKFKSNSIEIRQFPMPIQQMPSINTVVCIIATHLINLLIKSESYEHWACMVHFHPLCVRVRYVFFFF